MMNNKKLYLIGIAGLILLGMVAFLVGPALFAPAKPDGDPASISINMPRKEVFREDATLQFLTSGGTGRISISVEIADKEETRTQGLMGRDVLSPTHGMLFLFENSEERAFWMANTPLPLDILFIDANKRIIKIHHNTKPYSEESLPSDGPARYVLEVNGGFCLQNDIIVGDAVEWLRH